MNKSNTLSGQRSLVWSLLIIFCWSIFQPCFVFAGGPTQPETNSFTPVGVSDMVDPFTGDFTYNIPLMDVEGYPINIAYNSGVSMDQEATWVGLGWNLNTGAITRGLRGLPDDFRSDQVVKEKSHKPAINVGIDFGMKPEILGFSIMDGKGKDADTTGAGSLSLKLSTSLTYNNYTGYGTSISVGPSFNFAKFGLGSLSSGFSLSGSSENGASFAPSLSFEKKTTTADKHDISKTATIGAAMNSRSGLQSISYSTNYSKSHKMVNRNNEVYSKTDGKSGISGSFDFGLNNYTPSQLSSTWGASISLGVNVSGTLFGFDGQANVGVNFSKNWIPDELKTQTNDAYGYLYSEYGQHNAKALLDFNRDNDIPFSKYSKHLPSAFQTYDLFTISAQGTGGSFRAFRNDVGFVYDAASANFDVGANVGFELGAGNLVDVGVDVQIPYTATRNGVWTNRNYALNALTYMFGGPGKAVPGFSFIEASEAAVTQDNLMTDQFYGDKIEELELAGTALLPKLNGALIHSNEGVKNLYNNKKSNRELTNNQLYFLNRGEVQKGMGIFAYNTSLFDPDKLHHISEITQLGTDGRRYVFAVPAYNHFQEDVTFAVGNDLGNSGGIFPADDYKGLLGYTDGNSLASLDNEKGIDHYYSSTTLPAYAHSYMLSAVLSDDYVDADGMQGPSPGDLGSYVKLDYTEIENHQWRTPIEENTGYANPGMRTDKTDDKASFLYGEKDLFYVQKIETKNYVAIFKTSAREDAHSVKGRHGGLTSDTINAMRKLNSITLYSKRDYEMNNTNAVPIQKVEFVYDYSLCDDYPGNINGNGKLTLKEIKFTYQNSKKMKYRSYKFNYSSMNPKYDLKACDRWGTYKPNGIAGILNEGSSNDSPLTNSDFPYTIQDKALADQYAQAWSLTKIKLPSGGEINVDYESDDYAYVQHKKASQMFKIVGVYRDENEYVSDGFGGSVLSTSISSPDRPNMGILFKLENQSDKIEQYADKGMQMYFRALMILNPSGSNLKDQAEFISGYGTITELAKVQLGGVYYGMIKLRGEKLKDSGNDEYSPIAKQAILFGRTQLSRTITDIIGNNGDVSESEQGLTDFANATIGAFASFKEIFSGPNKYIYDLNRGREIVINKSWIRLYNPSGKKLGGGTRVKRIRIKDNWDEMNGSTSSEYGQEYSYTLEDGTSSGVASYEPQLGGDENTWHSAYEVNNKKLLATDDRMYIEDPIMESQFPSPSVGYSRVEIRDLKHANVIKTATGKVVKEFYTARDFPTIVKSTGADVLTKNSFLPLLPKFQYLTANEGFMIELNDMHGKPKKESVYAENKQVPLSTVEYVYQSENLFLDGVANSRLKNQVKVINPNGSIDEKTIGVRYDAVADFRESETVSQTGKLKINTNTMLFGFVTAFIPVLYPGYDRTTNRFRSATFNKTVQKFGVLEKTIANQDGSIVETNNLAYDAKTGEVLVTQTTTNFNDKVYSLNYPAYWKYDAFSQASTNILYSYKVSNLAPNGFAAIPSQYNLFVEGDEVMVRNDSFTKKGWVVEKNASGIRVLDKQGLPISGTDVVIKVIRSGHRNKQNTSMASMTSISNPLMGIGTNQFTNVLNAGAVEFADTWKTYCECFASSSRNPYVLGIKGNWRPVRSYTHLSGRTQTNYDANTNIRKDGVFTSYSPFYKLGQGKWEKDGQNWTFVSEVTEFSPNGMTLETRDALGRYSSSLFEFNNTLTTAVAANAKSQQITSGGFEDAGNTNCLEQGYFSRAKIGTGAVAVIPNAAIETTHVHTGRKSIKVEAGSPVVFENVISDCQNESSCDIVLSVTAGKQNTVGITGGQAPYQFTYEFIGNGAADAIMEPGNIISFFVDNAGDYLNIYITDSNGCKKGIKITSNGANSYQHEIINY